MSDAQPFETWTEHGATGMAQRANKKWKQDLASYEAPALDVGTDEALLDFMERRKRALPDLWHQATQVQTLLFDKLMTADAPCLNVIVHCKPVVRIIALIHHQLTGLVQELVAIRRQVA